MVKKLMDPTEVANTFSNFFIAITEKIKHSKNRERKGCINSKRFISWKLPSIKIISNTEACPSVIGHPLSYIYGD
jgi:hypothetical protein